MERDGDFYTFPLLADAPKHSIVGALYLGVIANETFEGSPWEVMEANGWVYSLSREILVPKESITIQISPPLAGFYFISQSPLIQAGSRNAAGRQVLSYDGEFALENFQLKLSEFGYE